VTSLGTVNGFSRGYDPRTCLTLGEPALADRVKRAVAEFRAAGTTMAK
jgi:hypothetical protein